jgi:DNA-binding CsgD family transcriptional regulator
VARASERSEGLLSRVQAAAEASAGRPVESALLAGARAEAARGSGSPARAAQAAGAAAGAWESLARPYPAAVHRWREAEARMLGGDRAGAAAAAAAARGVADGLGAAWLRDEIDGLASRARLATGEPAAGTAAAEPSGEEETLPFGLTARELQVLRLVAGGATNREVGAKLFMAEKTASVHVSRILAKLDVRLADGGRRGRPPPGTRAGFGGRRVVLGPWRAQPARSCPSRSSRPSLGTGRNGPPP